MNDLFIFVLGFMIMIVTVTAVVLIGQSEAQDPALNRNGSNADGG
jgi:hypothetical protein